MYKPLATGLPQFAEVDHANTGAIAMDSLKRARCWIEALLISLGSAAAIWVCSQLVTRFIPAATSGSDGQRFLLSLTGYVIAEWAFVIALWFVLQNRRSSFRELGVWRFGTWAGWLVALVFAALSIGSNLRFLPRMGVPISDAFMPTGFHLVASLMLGITAGFCEEVLFRGYLMTEFANAGYGKAMQVLIPGLAFGLGHAGFLNLGIVAWLGIVLPTAFLGMMWGIAYLLGRRSLVPTMVAHFLNDATALPWLAFMMFTMHR